MVKVAYPGLPEEAHGRPIKVKVKAAYPQEGHGRLVRGHAQGSSEKGNGQPVKVMVDLRRSPMTFRERDFVYHVIFKVSCSEEGHVQPRPYSKRGDQQFCGVHEAKYGIQKEYLLSP